VPSARGRHCPACGARYHGHRVRSPGGLHELRLPTLAGRLQQPDVARQHHVPLLERLDALAQPTHLDGPVRTSRAPRTQHTLNGEPRTPLGGAPPPNAADDTPRRAWPRREPTDRVEDVSAPCRPGRRAVPRPTHRSLDDRERLDHRLAHDPPPADSVGGDPALADEAADHGRIAAESLCCLGSRHVPRCGDSRHGGRERYRPRGLGRTATRPDCHIGRWPCV
jgi:hypothetical protein